MTIPWDTEEELKELRKKKEYQQGESISNLKTLIDGLPDNIPSDITMTFDVKIQSTKSTLRALFATFPDLVPEGITLGLDLQLQKKTTI